MEQKDELNMKPIKLEEKCLRIVKAKDELYINRPM